jgi:hypothetical protein
MQALPACLTLLSASWTLHGVLLEAPLPSLLLKCINQQMLLVLVAF